MFRTLTSLLNLPVRSPGFNHGQVDSVHIDTENWTIPELVICHGLLIKEKYEMATRYIDHIDWVNHAIYFDDAVVTHVHACTLTVEDERAHSHNNSMHRFNRHGYYWKHCGNPHLHDGTQLLGATIHTIEGEYGILADIIIDTESWSVAGFVVDLCDVDCDHLVRILVKDVARVGFGVNRLYVTLNKIELANAHAFDASSPSHLELHDGHYECYDLAGRYVYDHRHEDHAWH